MHKQPWGTTAGASWQIPHALVPPEGVTSPYYPVYYPYHPVYYPYYPVYYPHHPVYYPYYPVYLVVAWAQTVREGPSADASVGKHGSVHSEIEIG